MRPITVVAFGACFALTSAAAAETIRGQVRDKSGGAPVEGAVVHVSNAEGFETTVTTGADGRYAVDVAPGKYRIVFVQDENAIKGQIIVVEGQDTTFDARLKLASPEVIVIEELKRPAVLPEPVNRHVATAVPPYSDAAIERDAWTRAWLLLDVDETGKVTQLKFLKKPGYDLEPIAIAEGFKLAFKPARDDRNRPVRTFVLWPIEWPSMYYLTLHDGHPTRMPGQRAFGHGSAASRVPCKGSGPWKFSNRIAAYRGYRDCSRPDMTKVNSEPWILRPD